MYACWAKVPPHRKLLPGATPFPPYSPAVSATGHKSKFHLARHVTSWHDPTRSTCRAHANWLCRACQTAQLDTTSSARCTCTRRAHVFWLCRACRTPRLDTKSSTRWTGRPTHFGCVELVEQHGSTCSTRLARHVERVEPMHFGCVELVEQYGSTRSSRRARHVNVSRRTRWNFGFTLTSAVVDPVVVIPEFEHPLHQLRFFAASAVVDVRVHQYHLQLTHTQCLNVGATPNVGECHAGLLNDQRLVRDTVASRWGFVRYRHFRRWATNIERRHLICRNISQPTENDNGSCRYIIIISSSKR